MVAVKTRGELMISQTVVNMLFNNVNVTSLYIGKISGISTNLSK